jgi:orotidine-5'-phosphate decarboxylase
MKDRIVVALDTDSPGLALDTVSTLSGEVGLFKVGMELFPRGGADLIRKIRATGAEVFLDLKFHDIPNTVEGALRSAAALGVRFTTVHASGGKAMLAAAASAAKGTGMTVLAVTVLTSLDDADLAAIGFSLPAADAVVHLAALARDAGIEGIVCSAREARAIREQVGKDVVLVTPGVRLREDDVLDQKRVVTPAEAVRNGADYIVVGRPITKAADPVAAARRIAVSMEEGRRDRVTEA